MINSTQAAHDRLWLNKISRHSPQVAGSSGVVHIECLFLLLLVQLSNTAFKQSTETIPPIAPKIAGQKIFWTCSWKLCRVLSLPVPDFSVIHARSKHRTVIVPLMAPSTAAQSLKVFAGKHVSVSLEIIEVMQSLRDKNTVSKRFDVIDSTNVFKMDVIGGRSFQYR